jgi:hypothetical protein
MKKAKIVLLISLLIFIGLLLYFLLGPSKNDADKPVSLREQYQQEYQEKQNP